MTSLSILLIDDEPSVLCALRLLLTAFGHSVNECSGADIAQGKLAEGAKPDLILCDLKMPRMDGIQFLEIVRAQYPHLPFVLMSAHALSDEIDRAKRLGVSGFLGKPFTPDQLKEGLEAGYTHHKKA